MGTLNKALEAQSLNDIKETWKPILGYEGIYLVSDLGRIKRISSGRILKEIDKRGYSQICLYKNGVSRKFSAHRVVLEAFIGKSGLVTDHINEIKTDNRLSNLQYVSIRENSRRYWKKRRGLPTGVYKTIESSRYKTSITINSKAEYLGIYKTPAEAEAVFLRATELSVGGMKIKDIKATLANEAIKEHKEKHNVK